MARSWEADYSAYYQARGPALRRTAYLLAGSWHEADDLVQATFVKLYVHWRRVRAETVDAYARRVLINEYLMAKRRNRETPVDHITDSAAPQPSTVDRLVLDGALAGLPPRQRAAVVLRYWEDLSVAETAALLGVSTGTVKSSVARALHTLRLVVGPPPIRKEADHG
jgi:RNA polymerase sigma-70 factor (sigma-E family)